MRTLINILLLVIPVAVVAQPKFVYEGVIEYERKINVHRQVVEGEEYSDWIKDLLKSVPVFHESNFVLRFNNERSIYQLSGEMKPVPVDWITGPAKQNTVLTNFTTHNRTSVKSVFEGNFIISDSLGEIEWRVSDEKRTIAGFDCRKAVAKICDSVYVVAFYAEEIPVSGGPESFNGLPGMILGLAIPRLHTTWFATKVQLSPPVEKDFAITSRGSKTNNIKLQATLKTAMKAWDKYGQRHTWWVML